MKFLNKMCVALSVATCAAFGVVSCGPARVVGPQVLFQADAVDSIPYRIPTVATLHNGDILALADYRLCGSDIGYGRVDIHGRISRNGGRSWGKEFVLIEGTGVSKATDCGFGDAAMVADRESGEVLVVMVCGETVYWHETTTRQNPNRIAVLRSYDNAKSWTQWEEITEDVYSLFDNGEFAPVQSCFVASGKILQSKHIKVGSHYRIYAALCARPNGNRVIYSDDFGRTWHALGGRDALPVILGDEPKCEELPDGRVIISSRAWGGRYFNIYTYSDVASGVGQWGPVAGSGKKLNGCVAIENACNGELLIVPAVRKEDGRQVMLALQSVPLGPHRANVGIYYKELPEDVSSITPLIFASDWEKPYQVSETTSAYSTMLQLKNGNIVIYYEENENRNCRGGYDMIYEELTIETITSGRYE
jgi:sialidase-1